MLTESHWHLMYTSDVFYVRIYVYVHLGDDHRNLHERFLGTERITLALIDPH